MVENEFAHFLDAHAPVFERVLAELKRGEKRSHWMWYIFPQMKGLGSSFMAQRFAIQSLEQAKRYASHSVLGQRLRQCTLLANQIQDRGVSDIFGYPDDLKFHSCMTLFVLAVPEEPVFGSALEKFFDGQWDQQTLKILGRKA